MPTMHALDALFLQLEDRHVALHIGAVAVFEGPAPSTAEVHARYVRILATNPHYRRVLRHLPLEIGRPRWVDAGEVDLDYHLRRTALPAPGLSDQLEQVTGRLMSQALDQERPLWEAWVIEGLDGDRWALLTKVHHSVVDGLGGMALFTELLDGHGELDPPTTTGDRPALLGRLRGAVRIPHLTAGTVLHAVGGGVRLVRSLRPTSVTSLTGPLGTPRRYRTLSVALEDVRCVRAKFGGTINDVVLTLVTRGFHDLLLARGEQPRRDAVRCLVPVSVRTAAEANTGANRVSLLLVDLPVESSDPATTHRLIRTQTAELKGSGEASAGGHGLAAADLLPPALVAGAISLLRRVPQRVITTVATNVPGPRTSQTLLGRPLLALYPWVPIAEGIRIGVAVTSYDDQLHFGVTCDWAAVPDSDVFVGAMAQALADLTKRAAG
ncbi:MAG: wax ester/triacylglycerol synthase family O-acyltransferase [Jatrophihabitans sp.]